MSFGRNLSQTMPAQPINVNITDRSGMFGEFFAVEVARGGKARDTIRKVADS